MPVFQASELAPPGFSADCALNEDESTVVNIRATSASSPCPGCGAISTRVHSRYPRRLADLPMSGRRVVLMLTARRFRCDATPCARRIFAERFDDNVLKPWARRTARLDQIVQCWRLRWEAGRRRASPVGCAFRLATTPCCASCASAAVQAFRRLRSSESTTGLGVATNATGR